MREFFVYVLYRAGVALISVLPLPLLFRFGQFLGFAAWLFLPGYRRLALRNLSIAFANEKTARERSRLARRHFCRLGANFLCGIKVALIPRERLPRYIEVSGVETIQDHLRNKRGVVLVLSHLANWELISQILPQYIGHARNSTIYQPLRNRYIDAHVRHLRGRAGVEVFDRNEGFHRAIELLREGGAIGILSDQHAGDHGLWTPFFDRLASTTPLPALLAKRTGAALVDVVVSTIGAGRWRVTIEPGPEVRSASIDSLTARTNAFLSDRIRRAPEDWFWVHDRWKTPNPNFLLARYKRGVYLAANFPPARLKPFRILIRSSNWLGDACMSVPAVRALKAGRPDAHITILTAAKLEAMWRLVPEVDAILTLRGKSLWQAVRTVKKQPPFDVAVLFPNSFRSALEVWLAGVPRRIGRAGHSRHGLLNQIVRERGRPAPPEHHSRRFLHLAHTLGAPVPSDPFAQLSREAGLPPIKKGAMRLGLCPGAEYGPAKRWLADRFAEVARAVSSEAGAHWVLLGTAQEQKLGTEIAAALGDCCTNRIGETNLQDLIEELRACHLLLSNDTGTMHLSALLRIPTVAIFGSTEPALTGPLGRGHIVLRHHVECSPCFLRECPIDFRCMRAVEVEEVRQAVMSLLAGDMVKSAS